MSNLWYRTEQLGLTPTQC